MVPSRAVVALMAVVGLSACSLRSAACGLPSARGPAAPADADAAAAPAVTPPSTAGTSAATIKIAFLGDSLTAGLGLLSSEAYPSLIQDAFTAEGYTQVEVVNAGVSGDTTAGGLRRVNGVLDQGASILVVALGGNDALRGLTVKDTHDNLAGILQAAGRHDVGIVLAGMLAPTNLGQDYQTAFAAVYPQVAREYPKNLVFVPFLLEGVAGHPGLNQADGIHPNAQGARVVADLLYPKLRSLVDAMGGGG
jgi:acyl-CoA thioesterase I